MALIDAYTTRFDMVAKAEKLLFHHLHSMKIYNVKPEQVHVIDSGFRKDGFVVLFNIDKPYFNKELYEIYYADDRVNNTVTYTLQIYRSIYQKTCKLPIE